MPLAAHQIDLLLKIFVPFDCYGSLRSLNSSITFFIHSTVWPLLVVTAAEGAQGQDRGVNTENKCCVKFISLHWHFMMTWRVLFHFLYCLYISKGVRFEGNKSANGPWHRSGNGNGNSNSSISIESNSSSHISCRFEDGSLNLQQRQQLDSTDTNESGDKM